MSRYYTVRRESRTYSGIDEFKTLRGVLRYVRRTYGHNHNKLASEYTLTITQRDGYELVEKHELKRLKAKYEKKQS